MPSPATIAESQIQTSLRGLSRKAWSSDEKAIVHASEADDARHYHKAQVVLLHDAGMDAQHRFLIRCRDAVSPEAP